MTFVTDKEELKPGLIIFRRGDVAHRNFYCRIRLPKEDRYKTFSLRTPEVVIVRQMAYRKEADIEFRIEHDVLIFNRPFCQVAEEYISVLERRVKSGEVSADSLKNTANRCRRVLDDYVGSTQIHLIGQERWTSYPSWRRETGKGRLRERISDATIGAEMGAFNAVMNFAVSKRYVPASHRFEGKPKLKTMRPDEFTLEEYRKLHSFGRSWIKLATSPQGTWYRTMCYNFMLIMCNTGMRPPEAKNSRWKDVTTAKDRDGREIVVLFVQGSGIPRSTYCFRHTYATFRLSEGVDVYLLAEQVGTSVKMIEQYYGHVNTIKHADRVLMGMTGFELVRESSEDDVAAAKVAKAAATRDKASRPAIKRRRTPAPGQRPGKR